MKIKMIPRPTYAPAMAELTQKPSGLFADRRAMRAALAAHLLIVSVNIHYPLKNKNKKIKQKV
ncbi:hypothetical protein ACLBOM_05265 [Escherichia coli]